MYSLCKQALIIRPRSRSSCDANAGAPRGAAERLPGRAGTGVASSGTDSRRPMPPCPQRLLTGRPYRRCQLMEHPT